MIFNFRVSRQNIQETRAARRRKARGTSWRSKNPTHALRLVPHAYFNASRR